MALMDMAEIEPLLETLPRLLVPGDRFVFTAQHLCFNSNAMTMVAELVDRDGELVAVNSVKLSGYLDVPPGKGAGMPGEPAAHYYFHRPLGELLGACFRAGFVMDGIEEPAFEDKAEESSPLSWKSCRQIPPVFAARMRLVG